MKMVKVTVERLDKKRMKKESINCPNYQDLSEDKVKTLQDNQRTHAAPHYGTAIPYRFPLG